LHGDHAFSRPLNVTAQRLNRRAWEMGGRENAFGEFVSGMISEESNERLAQIVTVKKYQPAAAQVRRNIAQPERQTKSQIVRLVREYRLMLRHSREKLTRFGTLTIRRDNGIVAINSERFHQGDRSDRRHGCVTQKTALAIVTADSIGGGSVTARCGLDSGRHVNVPDALSEVRRPFTQRGKVSRERIAGHGNWQFYPHETNAQC